MLIHLKKELFQEKFDKPTNNDQFKLSIQNLIQSRIQGNHIFFMERGTVALIENSRLDDLTIRILKNIESNAAQYGSLVEKLLIRIEVSNFGGIIEKTLVGGRTIINIPLLNFLDNRIAQRTKLICENLNDCRFYEYLSLLHIKKYNSRNLPTEIRFERIGGGGNTTAESLREISENDNVLALCMTDNDKVTPTSPCGQTTKLCREVSISNLCYHQDVGVRYVENLLHYEQIKSILSSTRETKALLTKLEFIKKIENTEYWFHVPLKTGLKLGTEDRIAEQKYWREILQEDFDSTYHIPPISSNLLKWAVDLLSTNNLAVTPPDNPIFQRWEELSHLIASWGCSSEPIRV